MPLLSGLEILIIAQTQSSPQPPPKEGEPEREVIIGDFVVGLGDFICQFDLHGFNSFN